MENIKKDFIGFLNFLKNIEEETFCEHDYEQLYENICQCKKCGKIRPQKTMFTEVTDVS